MLNWIVWNGTVYLYKMDLALNNLQRLICHKIQTNKQINKDEIIIEIFKNRKYWLTKKCYQDKRKRWRRKNKSLNYYTEQLAS